MFVQDTGVYLSSCLHWMIFLLLERFSSRFRRHNAGCVCVCMCGSVNDVCILRGFSRESSSLSIHKNITRWRFTACEMGFCVSYKTGGKEIYCVFILPFRCPAPIKETVCRDNNLEWKLSLLICQIMFKPLINDRVCSILGSQISFLSELRNLVYVSIIWPVQNTSYREWTVLILKAVSFRIGYLLTQP